MVAGLASAMALPVTHELVVLRGTAVMVVLPTDGTEEIANPFLGQE